ncbi:uncharacterized protein BT62DRAFT_921346 [Guyanagaster necrorhizus]|uniref:Uncharacterized protein n=1 Tax=Guyanagaster necrorhizus TaxID=856835 RepID=A0A9P7VP05_9AGAR|nr:uncharacterized protein BT62DRAFT_921346 [Guyanagaster necrorhizus MCA 3950]KAG7444053.1 hypothetical protein BT62DRAFT_921346 [Guyanagaster necrorhizus MCA 3950]
MKYDLTGHDKLEKERILPTHAMLFGAENVCSIRSTFACSIKKKHLYLRLQLIQGSTALPWLSRIPGIDEGVVLYAAGTEKYLTPWPPESAIGTHFNFHIPLQTHLRSTLPVLCGRPTLRQSQGCGSRNFGVTVPSRAKLNDHSWQKPAKIMDDR